MWDREASEAPNQLSPTRYAQNVGTADDRHNPGRNTVRMTVITDVRLSSMTPSDGPRTSANAKPGNEIQVGAKRAAALEAAGQAVRVDIAKLGEGQRRLLLRLHELATEEERSGSIFRAIVGIFSPITTTNLSEGDALSRSPHTRIRWDAEEILDGYPKDVSRSALSQALRHLERRGLVLRDVPWGARGRTHSVEVTTAGRRLAMELERKR